MSGPSLVRTVYLYLFALLGLVLMTIGSVRFVDMGLKTLVFKQADEEQRFWQRQPPMPPVAEGIKRLEADRGASPDQIEALRQWQVEYETWRETAKKVDPVRARRERDASMSLAMLLTGIPLYTWHWRLIRRQHGDG